MKGFFEIPSAKELLEERRSGKKRRRKSVSSQSVPPAPDETTQDPVTFSSQVASSGIDIVDEDVPVKVTFPAHASSYSDPSFVVGLKDSLLLPEDERRLGEIGVAQAADWSVARFHQALTGGLFLSKTVAAQEKRNHDLSATNSQLRKQLVRAGEVEKELRESRAVVQENLQSARTELESARSQWETERADLLARLKTVATEAVLKTRAELMAEFKDTKGEGWDPDEEIELYQSFLNEPDEGEPDEPEVDGTGTLGDGTGPSDPAVD